MTDKMKVKFKQFICWLKGHGLSSAEVSREGVTVASRRYCSKCYKTFHLYFSDKATQDDRLSVLKNI